MACLIPYATVILPPVVTWATWDGFTLSLASNGTSLADGLDSASLTLSDSAGVEALVVPVTVTDGPTFAISAAAITPMTLAAGTYTGFIAMDTGDAIRKWYKIQLSVIE